VTFSGVGVIVGAGIYVLIGAVAGVAGNALWLSFLLAAVVAAFTGISYARFAARQPKDSPEFQYTAMAFGNRAGFVSGWLMLWADLIAIAAVALGFGSYFSHITHAPLVLGALGLVAVMSLLAWWGIGESVLMVVVFTAVEVGGLLFITVLDIGSWGSVDYLAMPHGFMGVWSGAALAVFAYLGFDELGNLAEETRDPTRTLPRAIALAMIISTALYIAVSVSAVSVVGWEALSNSSAPLALVAGRVLGSGTDSFLTLLALAATSNTVLLLIISGARAIYGMAGAGVLPKHLSAVGRRRTPWLATLLTLVVAGAFVLIGNLETVAKLTDGVVLVPFALVNLSLLWVLHKRTGSSAFRWLATDIAPPLAGVGLCAFLFVHTGGKAMLTAGGLVAAGLALTPLLLRGLRAGR
jgi:APA family basic amino acid/polyamine antiporter